MSSKISAQKSFKNIAAILHLLEQFEDCSKYWPTPRSCLIKSAPGCHANLFRSADQYENHDIIGIGIPITKLIARPCCMADHSKEASSVIPGLPVNAPMRNLRFVRQCIGTQSVITHCRINGKSIDDRGRLIRIIRHAAWRRPKTVVQLAQS